MVNPEIVRPPAFPARAETEAMVPVSIEVLADRLGFIESDTLRELGSQVAECFKSGDAQGAYAREEAYLQEADNFIASLSIDDHDLRGAMYLLQAKWRLAGGATDLAIAVLNDFLDDWAYGVQSEKTDLARISVNALIDTLHADFIEEDEAPSVGASSARGSRPAFLQGLFRKK